MLVFSCISLSRCPYVVHPFSAHVHAAPIDFPALRPVDYASALPGPGVSPRVSPRLFPSHASLVLNVRS